LIVKLQPVDVFLIILCHWF